MNFFTEFGLALSLIIHFVTTAFPDNMPAQKGTSSKKPEEHRIPSPSELVAAARKDMETNRKLQERIKQYAGVFRARTTEIDVEIKAQVKELVDESVTELEQIETERADTLRQLSELHDIRVRLSDAIQKKHELKHRMDAELQRRKRAAIQRSNESRASSAKFRPTNSISRVYGKPRIGNEEIQTPEEQEEFKKLFKSLGLLKDADANLQVCNYTFREASCELDIVNNL